MTQPSTDTTRRVLRWEVPVDDEWHEVTYEGEIVFVDSRDPRVVEFWTVRGGTQDGAVPGLKTTMEFRVYGTGHAVDEVGVYVGSAPTLNGVLVWHLFWRKPGDGNG